MDQSPPAGLDLGRAALLDPVAIRSRLTGRSLWSLLMWDGTVLSEGQRDWLDLPRGGRRSLRLYCPTGECATLDDGHDAAGRLFQLKVAVVGIGNKSRVLAHVAGMIVGTDGQSLCAAWDYRTKRLVTFHDNATRMTYENIGPLCGAHLGISPG